MAGITTSPPQSKSRFGQIGLETTLCVRVSSLNWYSNSKVPNSRYHHKRFHTSVPSLGLCATPAPNRHPQKRHFRASALIISAQSGHFFSAPVPPHPTRSPHPPQMGCPTSTGVLHFGHR